MLEISGGSIDSLSRISPIERHPLIIPTFLFFTAALSGNRNEELASIEDLLKKKPDSVSYKERILLMVHEGMKRLGFFGIFLCASVSPCSQDCLARMPSVQYLVSLTYICGPL